MTLLSYIDRKLLSSCASYLKLVQVKPDVIALYTRSPNAARPKTTQRHPMPGTIIQVADIADGIGLLPT
jgi:hypothetical protein